MDLGIVSENWGSSLFVLILESSSISNGMDIVKVLGGSRGVQALRPKSLVKLAIDNVLLDTKELSKLLE